MLPPNILAQAERPLHLAMSADQSGQVNADARESVPAGPPDPKAKGKAARKMKAKSARNKNDKDADGATTADHAKTIITELGPAIQLLYTPGCDCNQAGRSSTDDMPPLIASPRGRVEEKRIYPGDKEQVAYTFDGFKAFAGNEKRGLQMWNESPSTAPGNVSLAPAGSADRKGKGSKAKSKGKGGKAEPETVGSSSSDQSGSTPGTSSGHKDSRWRTGQKDQIRLKMCPLETRHDIEDFDGGRCAIGPPSTCDKCKGCYPVASMVISCRRDGTIPKMASGKLQKTKRIIDAEERSLAATKPSPRAVPKKKLPRPQKLPGKSVP